MKLSSAFVFHYLTTTGIGYCFPGTNTVFKLSWNLEIYSRKLINQNLLIFIDFSETFTINGAKTLELKFQLGPPRESVFAFSESSAEEE